MECLTLSMVPGLFSQCFWKGWRKMTRRWPKAGKQELTGSSSLCGLYLLITCFAYSSVIDWFILCCCCIVDLSVDSGHSTEPTGHLQLLPCKYLSSCCRPKPIQHSEFPPFSLAPIFSTKLCHLRERTLVLELGDQSNVWFTCNVATAMGTKIP